MDNTIIICCASAFVLSALFASMLMPIILKYCKNKRLFDLPNERKIHQNTNIPRLAGVVFAPVVAAAVGVVTLCLDSTGGILANKNFNISFVSMGTAVIFIAGLIDDTKGLHPQMKLVMQLIAACVLSVSGLGVCSSLFGCGAIAAPLDFALTVFFTVYVINAINFIDGIDGLCGLYAMLVMLVLLPFLILKGDFLYAMAASAVVGAVAAFLPYNLFGNASAGTKVFMGDTGSLTLGFIICAMGMRVSAYGCTDAQLCLSPKVVFISFLAVPMFDLCKVAVVRAVHHRNIFSADKGHIHHRLMAAGLSQHKTLATIITITLLVFLINCTLLPSDSLAIIALFDIFCMAMGSLLLEYIIKVRG